MEQTLTPEQYKVLNSLISGKSISEAAREAGLHRNTVTNWRRQIPAFSQLLTEAHEERTLLLREEAEALSFKAIQVLREILENEEASPSVRLRAALAVLKLANSEPKTDKLHNPAQPAAPKAENLHKPAQQQPLRLPAGPGRNTQCPCKSGMKYKRCCANKPATTPVAA